MFTGLILSGLLAAALQPPPPAGRVTAAPPDKPDPLFGALFQPTGPEAAQPAATATQPGTRAPHPSSPPRRATGPRTKVVCGMTLIIVGPEVDPEMAKPTPEDGVTYTMRRYPPPACGRDSAKEK